MKLEFTAMMLKQKPVFALGLENVTQTKKKSMANSVQCESWKWCLLCFLIVRV